MAGYSVHFTLLELPYFLITVVCRAVSFTTLLKLSYFVLDFTRNLTVQLKVKYEWRYTSTPKYACTTCSGDNLTLYVDILRFGGFVLDY